MERLNFTTHFNVLVPRLRTTSKIEIDVLPSMYKPARNPEDHWLHLTFRGFISLREVLAEQGKMPPYSFCSIGTSTGLDAIGAWETLPLEEIVLTDILDDVLSTCRENVKDNCIGLKMGQLKAYQGNLLDPLCQRDKKVDIIYENLPNLPSTTSFRQLRHSGALAASFYATDGTRSFDGIETLLELHSSFLAGAKQCLTPRGCVVCAIGGRLPWQNINDLFLKRGFQPQILAWTIKPQEQARECLPEYARHEKSVLFNFLQLTEARKALRSLVVDLRRSATEIAEELERKVKPHTLTASAAVRLNAAKPGSVGHLAYLILGTQAHNGA